MSSALLYLAIVVIWACVLVPRWLRRDSANELAAEDSRDEAGISGDEEEYPDEGYPAAKEHAAKEHAAKERAAKEHSVSQAPHAGEGDQPVVLHPDHVESRRRVLAARRRLLFMLLLLAVAAACLALAKLAAWWVVLPPLLMLAGYLLLLREASRTDAERARDADERARDAARARDAERAGPEPSARPEAPRRTVAEAAPAGQRVRERSHAPVPPPDAEVIDISAQVDEEDFYDQYTDARLRAVGD